MKFFLLSLLLPAATALLAQSAPLTADAQIKKLQADPNVVWMGETYSDFVDLDGTREGRPQDRIDPVEMGDGLKLYNQTQNTSIIKLQRPNGGASGMYWSDAFFSYMFDENTLSFADADLTKKLSLKEKNALCSSIDTLIMIDPNTLKETRTAVVNTIDPDKVASYRVREIIYYDKKNEQYQVLPIAIAPIVLQYDDTGKKYTGHKLLFWVPINALSTPINVQTVPNTPYIRSVQIHLPLKDAKELKGTQNWAKCNEDMLEKLRKEKDKAFVVGTMSGDNELNPALPAAEIGNIGASIDTVIVYDPENKSRDTTVVNNKTKGKDIEMIRVNHVFAWDEKKRQLSVHIYSFAPIIRRYDDTGKFLNQGPLFYLLPHKRYRTASK